MIKSEKVDTILPALLKVKLALRPLVKDSDNPFYKSKYLELSDILSNLEPILHSEGLFLSQATIVRDGKTVVVNEITHAASGQYVASEFPAEPAKNDPQALGSAVSYARRYGIQSLLSLNVVDDDGNTASGKSGGSSAPASSAPKPAFGSAQSQTAKPAASSAPEAPKAEESNAPAPRRGTFGQKG